MRGLGKKRRVDSQAVRVRTAWYLVIANVNGVCEVHIGYKYYDQSLGLFSTAASSDPCKPPWGAIRGCKFKSNVRNAKGDIADYYEMENGKGEKRLFKIAMMNPLLWGVNDFTQQVTGLRVGLKEELLSVYLSLLVAAAGFSHHRPGVNDSSGFVIETRDLQIEEMEKVLGSLSELRSLISHAEGGALRVGARKEVSELISTKPSSSDAAGPKSKMSKKEKIEVGKQDEIDDKDGVEQMLVKSYLARELISIDKLSISKKVCTEMNEYKVLGLAKSIKSRCDPSNLVLTVIPKEESFDGENIDSNHFEVINGRHCSIWIGSICHL